MATATTHDAEGVAHRVTRHIPFFPCNPAGAALFSVNPGIPAVNALEQAECFLDATVNALRELAVDRGFAKGNGGMWSALYLAELSHATVQAAREAIETGESREGGAI